MGLFTKDIKTMNDLFIHQLQDIYYAEKQLVKALPKMAEKGHRQAAQAGLFDPSRRNQDACAAPRGGIPHARRRGERRSIARRSTASSRKPTRSRARSPTRPCWTQP